MDCLVALAYSFGRKDQSRKHRCKWKKCESNLFGATSEVIFFAKFVKFVTVFTDY